MRPAPTSLALAALCFLVFAQVSTHEFVDWDDGVYVTENPMLMSGLTPASIWDALVTPHLGNWIPVTHLSLLFNRAITGPGPTGFLLGNLLLHTLATVVLFLALARMTGALGRSAFVAAIFAIHPLHVESVAWVSERKDVLAGLFFGGTLYAYARFAEQTGSKRRYALVLLLLACGLLSKPTLVTLPFVLLLLDFWPLGRLHPDPRAGARRVLLEKIPMFALVAAVSAITFWLQKTEGGMVFAQRELPLSLRLWNALDSYGVYFVQSVWPSELSVFYPHPGEAVSRGRAALAGLGLLAISGAAFAFVRRAPYLLVGWLWFLGMLVPMIGIVQVGMQAHADRYMYLPLQGLAIAAAWGAVDLVGSSQLRRRGLAIFAAGLVLVFTVAAHRQAATWRDSLTLFGRAVALDPDNLAMQQRYAIALRKAGRLDEALERYSDIIRREPRWAAPKLELGALFEEREELDKALESYQEGLRLDPKHAPGHASVGRVKLQMGRFEEALAAFERAKALGSDSAALDALLATAAQLLGRDADAIRENRSALARDPELISAANNLAWVLATSRDPALREPAEAVRLAELAVEKQAPPDPGYLDTLAASYAADGRFDDAVRTATSALDLAMERGDGATAKEIRARLDLFRAHRAWVEPARE